MRIEPLINNTLRRVYSQRLQQDGEKQNQHRGDSMPVVLEKSRKKIFVKKWRAPRTLQAGRGILSPCELAAYYVLLCFVSFRSLAWAAARRA